MTDFSEFCGDEVGVYMSAIALKKWGRWVLRCWTTMLSAESSCLVASDHVEINPFVPVYVARSYSRQQTPLKGFTGVGAYAAKLPTLTINLFFFLPLILILDIGRRTCH